MVKESTKFLTRKQRQQLQQRGTQVKQQQALQSQKIQATIRRKKGKPDVIISDRGKFYRVGDKFFDSENRAFAYQDAIDKGRTPTNIRSLDLKKQDFQFVDITAKLKAQAEAKRQQQAAQAQATKPIQITGRVSTSGDTITTITQNGKTSISVRSAKQPKRIIKPVVVDSALVEAVKKDLGEQIFNQTQSIQNRITTGQTVSPQELRLYKLKLESENKELNIRQLRQLKNVVLSPITYGRNLVIRAEGGESNPLLNDVKRFLSGLKTTTIDPIRDIGKLAWKGTKFTIKGAFDYGRRLSAEAQKGNFVLDDDLKKLGKVIVKGAKTSAQKTQKLAAFVKKNPQEAALAVGAASLAGVTFVGTKGEQLAMLGYESYKKDPAFFLGQAVGALGLVEAKALQAVGKGVQVVSKLSPKYVKRVDGKFVINKKPLPSVSDFIKNKAPKEIKDLLKEFTRNPKIILKEQTVATGARPLSKQAELAGQKVTAVNAAADQLTSWIGTKRLIRKPIPGESDFPKAIKDSLKRFDAGQKLSKKEFASVNLWLKKNVAPNITLLERSLYADPAGGLRVSRLGIQKTRDASLKDIIKGNFRFTGNKPQVLVFENAQVAKFPNNLKDIESKLRAGKKLTENETNRLIAWQIKTGSGKFKPIGSTIYRGGKELEVTIAPGEYIKRIRSLGFTYIDGRKVTFASAEIYKPAKSTLAKVKKAQDGKLSAKELTALEKELKNKLGRKVNVQTPASQARALSADVPVLRIDRLGLRSLNKARFASLAKRIKAQRATVRKATKRATPKRTTTTKAPARKAPVRKPTTKRPVPRKPGAPRKAPPRKPTPPRIPKSPVKRAPPRSPPRTPKTPARAPPKKPPIIIPKKFDSKLLNDKVLKFLGTYRERKNVNKPAGRSNPIITKTINILDTKNRAIKRVAQFTDKRLVRSFDLKVVGIGKGKKDIGLPKEIKKFRLKKAKSSPALRLVEKAKHLIDTKAEKRELKKSKALKKKKTLKR